MLILYFCFAFMFFWALWEDAQGGILFTYSIIVTIPLFLFLRGQRVSKVTLTFLISLFWAWETIRSEYDIYFVAMTAFFGAIWLYYFIMQEKGIEEEGGSAFSGAYFRNFLRGTYAVNSHRLANFTTEPLSKSKHNNPDQNPNPDHTAQAEDSHSQKNQGYKDLRYLGEYQSPSKDQIIVAGIPMPRDIENLHLLIGGSTGTGKSVLIKELVLSAFTRRDRLIIADPDGELLSTFWREGDVILNPYDARTEGWSFFNEIRNDFDFKRFALSIVPKGKTFEAEEWAGYARLLLRETARKLSLSYSHSYPHSLSHTHNHKPLMQELVRLTTIATPEELQKFLKETDAASLFVGADKALASARFILSDKLPEYKNMPEGMFSIRTWLDDPKGGNLFITWREDMAESLKPLISAWIDVICTSVLSLPDAKNNNRPLWLILDELASLDHLASLQSALTKGRKKGLRVVAGLQSTAQLENIYSHNEAITLRSCFRSLVVLGGARTDPRTCEDMSMSLGAHEVERDNYSQNEGSHSGYSIGGYGSYNRGSSSGSTISNERAMERVVLPSEIASLPDLTGYLAFAGDLPIARVNLNVIAFDEVAERFIPRKK